jgi:transposase-like protein
MNICPVCGFPHLTEAPRSLAGGASYEICPSCGFQFGVDDEDKGHSYAAWRADWQKRGMPWS